MDKPSAILLSAQLPSRCLIYSIKHRNTKVDICTERDWTVG